LLQCGFLSVTFLELFATFSISKHIVMSSLLVGTSTVYILQAKLKLLVESIKVEVIFIPEMICRVRIYTFFLAADNRGERKERPFGGTTHEDMVDSSHGFRSICASPDGQHLAAGDWSGNLRIYDLHSLQLISFQVRVLLAPPFC
jgi:hypothetical protein